MPLVSSLAHTTETELNELCLTAAWERSGLGALPAGDGAVAKLRLAMMAQLPELQTKIIHAFENDLDPCQRGRLSEELSRTGIDGQHSSFDHAAEKGFGPAFL